MEIRPGKEGDIEKALPIIQRFHEEALEGFGFFGDVEKITEIAKKCIDNCLVIEQRGCIVGIIAGMVVTAVTDKELMFHEFIWYTLPAYRHMGIKLYRAMEKRCRDAGIKRMLMVRMCNGIGERIDKVYKRLGYNPIEIHYTKEI